MRRFHLLFLFLSLLISINIYSQNIIQVVEGTDGIDAAYSIAQAGDIIELITDGGIYTESNDFVIDKDKPITIRAAEGVISKPRWKASGGWALVLPADDITLKGIIIDGTVGGGHREVGIRCAEPEWQT